MEEQGFSNASKEELARLSPEAKNLVCHIIQSAVEEQRENAPQSVTRAQVILISERFGPFFEAAVLALPPADKSESDALKAQLAQARTDLDAAIAEISDLKAKLEAAPKPQEYKAACEPAPQADPLAPPPAAEESPAA